MVVCYLQSAKAAAIAMLVRDFMLPIVGHQYVGMYYVCKKWQSVQVTISAARFLD